MLCFIYHQHNKFELYNKKYLSPSFPNKITVRLVGPFVLKFGSGEQHESLFKKFEIDLLYLYNYKRVKSDV